MIAQVRFLMYSGCEPCKYSLSAEGSVRNRMPYWVRMSLSQGFYNLCYQRVKEVESYHEN